MTTTPTPNLIARLRKRRAPLDLRPDEFRALGHHLVDQIADFLGSLPSRKVTPCEPVQSVRQLIDFNRSLPEQGTEPGPVLARIADQLFDHSLHNGHPRFWGYVTSSAAPIGALADFLASAVNPNAGGWKLAPLATEIEVQTIRWIAELIGYPSDCGGLLLSGGNMANFVGFLVGRRTKCGWDVRQAGMQAGAKQLRVYTSQETHTWIQKAADLFGLGTDAIVWVPVDGERRMDAAQLRSLIQKDRAAGLQPLMVAGTAGSVGTGAVDPLNEIADICAENDLWFHVDGAYGAFAAALPDASPDLRALSRADSVAMDPHKWLYAPLEAGCVLVRRRQLLLDTFSYHPPYYHFDPELTQFFDLGPQNSRGFRALKVWLALQQVGREGYVRMISDDIKLAGELYRILPDHPELERQTRGLSIVTFRYIPSDLRARCGDPDVEKSLDDLNREILDRLEASGEAFLSNAMVNGRFCLRLCIVNFRTSLEDIEALPPLIVRLGAEADWKRRGT
ncbi:MAG: aspartate aminotransferase family protein [Acidobacteria bacterium]|nr:MAG: aspartate aminotransferase family protein [Acidobacteriota bacterium]